MLLYRSRSFLEDEYSGHCPAPRKALGVVTFALGGHHGHEGNGLDSIAKQGAHKWPIILDALLSARHLILAGLGFTEFIVQDTCRLAPQR